MLRIPRAAVLTQDRNTGYAAFAFGVSLFVFAYSIRFGQLPILVFYALWLPLVAIEPRLLLKGVWRQLPLLALPTFAVLSTFWSENPDATLRASIQYLSTIVCVVIAARVATSRSIALGGLYATVPILGYSFYVGNYSYDFIDGTYTLVGAFGSKNILGFYATLGLLFAAGVLAFFRTSWPERVVIGAIAAVALVTLVLSRSATSVITIGGTFLVAAVAVALTRIMPTERSVVVAVLVAVVLATGFLAVEAGFFDNLLAIFGRDTTLTGRTYLWREGLIAAEQNPFTGMGYQAFWTQGFDHAERLWEEFYITSRTGFSFHNSYIDIYVGLGLIGLALLLLTVGLSLFWAARMALGVKALPETIFCASLILMLIVRSLVETTFISQYSSTTFIFYFAILRLADLSRAERTEPRTPDGSESPRFANAPTYAQRAIE